MVNERIKLVRLLTCVVVLLSGCPREDGEPGDLMKHAAGSMAPDAGEDPRSDPKDEPKPEKPQPEKPQPEKPKPEQADAGPKPETKPPAQPSSPMIPSKGEPTPPKPAMMDMPANQGPAPAHDQRFFMPTPEPHNTQFPRVEFDAKGGMHAVYPAYARGGAFYAYCPNECADPTAMKVVELPTDSAPSTAMLALTEDGKPRVLLPTYLHLYYAQCDHDCTESANWTTSIIVDHQSNQEVTGDALAVDSKGHPRFIMHTYVAYLGVGQKEPHTYYAQCDDNCNDSASWHIDAIQDQIWQYSTLKIDAADHAHLGTVTISPSSSVKQLAYIRCDADCRSSASWNGIQLAPAFELSTADIRPSVSLALTSTGGARMVGLVMPEPGARNLVYFECDQACDQDNWNWGIISTAYELGSGVDIAVDAKDRPRFVFTLNSNIGLYHCNDTHCTQEGAPWDLIKVEAASDLRPDTIILWPNCVADAWLLHDPTLMLAPSGAFRVGYTATDVSGGTTSMPDPTMTPCIVGKDMTLARMASLRPL